MSYQFNTLQDCLDECTRIDTARANCITAMNACGLTTPNDASLGMLPHYFGCDSYIGPTLPSKSFATFDDASTAIAQINTKKNNLKTLINVFCAPKNIKITNQSMNEYYKFIQNTGTLEFRVQWISNPSSSDYIDLGYSLNRDMKLSASISWGDFYHSQDVGDYMNLLFGAEEIVNNEHIVYGLTAKTGNYVTGSPFEDGVFRWCSKLEYSSGEFLPWIKQDPENPKHLENDTKYVCEDATGHINAHISQSGDDIYEIQLAGIFDGWNNDNRLYPNGPYNKYQGTQEQAEALYPVPNTHCTIFNNSGNCPSGSKFYSGQIKNSDGTVIHNLLPYIEWTGCSWLAFVKDTVTNTKYYNLGPNEFTYGPIVTN